MRRSCIPRPLSKSLLGLERQLHFPVYFFDSSASFIIDRNDIPIYMTSCSPFTQASVRFRGGVGDGGDNDRFCCWLLLLLFRLVAYL